ncbi:MAG: hypothetical protein R8P61_06010 [Bacteroidia bacterium]|nr:hypothetical protein [Bacteroidia bacterium]
MNSLLQKAWIWALLFLFILVLESLPIWQDWSLDLSFLGFPPWLWFLMGVHLLLIAFLFLFSKHYLKDNS